MVAQRRADGSVEVGFTERAMGVKALIESAAQLAAMIPLEDVHALIDEYQRAQTIAPMFDPTSWMRVQGSAEQHFALASAFLTFRKAIERIMDGCR